MPSFVWLFLLVVLGVLLIKWALRPVTILEFERGLQYTRGRFQGLLTPGLYWVVPPLTMIRTVDLRPTFVSITGQEVLSADGVTLKASLAAQYQVVEPETAMHSSADYQGALYLELQLSLRHSISAASIDALLSQRQSLGQQLMQHTEAKAAALGLRLLAVEIKDLTLPGDLKKIFTQVVKARQEGLAALEKARGETAALRHLANAAHMVERTPALLQLRLLQTLGDTSGHTVILGMPPQGMPVPITPSDTPDPAR